MAAGVAVARFFSGTVAESDDAADEQVRHCLRIAKLYNGAINVRDLLSSSRLTRLAMEVLVEETTAWNERRAAQQAQAEEDQWQAAAAARMARYQ